MINHLAPIDMAMQKAIDDGKQTQIIRYLDLPDEELFMECVTRTHNVKTALMRHIAYKKSKKEVTKTK